MENQSFTISITIDGSPQEVLDRIHQVPKWWTEDFEGSNTKLGDEFVIHHPGAHYSKQRVTEAVPGKKMVWLVTESELSWLEKKDELTATRMIFELTADGDNTILQFTHEGLVPEK
ncbi:MAG TPA: SRPBCC domain-containing protein, partial [Mucilaginibacter sp.]|nr:SRPBCC domain-containing protein [Mucilaginibacter sp.]